MSWSLSGHKGVRKYLTASERVAFIQAAKHFEPQQETFCLTIALTGARISEVLALTVERIDAVECTIVFETLKRRRRGIFRAVPVPRLLISRLEEVHGLSNRASKPCSRLWTFSRPTAWKYVKEVMNKANVPAAVSMPRALRHAFGVEAVRQRIALSVLRKWMGHAKIETTAIYADPVGEEERALAELMWPNDCL